MNNKKQQALNLIIIGFAILGVVLMISGFEKLDYTGYFSRNAYVKGDAYNLMINASYFIGYVVSGFICSLASVIAFCTKEILKR